MRGGVSAVGCMPLLDCAVAYWLLFFRDAVCVPLPPRRRYPAAEPLAPVERLDNRLRLITTHLRGGPEIRARDLYPNGAFLPPEGEDTLRYFEVEAVSGVDEPVEEGENLVRRHIGFKHLILDAWPADLLLRHVGLKAV